MNRKISLSLSLSLFLAACGHPAAGTDLGPLASRTSEAVLDIAAGPDLAAPPDLRDPADLTPAFDPTKLVDVLACAPDAMRHSRGYLLTADQSAVACPAQLLKPQDVEKVCVEGYHPCEKNPLSADLCASLPIGFYVGRKAVGWQLPTAPPQDLDSFVCFWNPSNYREGGPPGNRVLRGCGVAPGTGPAKIDLCAGGFTRIAGCDGPSSWLCPRSFTGTTDSDFPSIQNADKKAGGVLCCR